MENNALVERLAANYRSSGRVRYNCEEFGFIVGFPDGDIVLTTPEAMTVISSDVKRADLEPFHLTEIVAGPGFHLSTPPLVWLELTHKCNLTCPHCYIDAGRARRAEMPTERWLSLLDEMAAMGVWAVAFTGGEPTLHPDFARLVRRARENDLLVGIATHGMFLTDELLAELPRDGVIVSVSIDDIHLGRRRSATTEEAQAAIIRAQAHGFPTNVMSTTHRRNIHELAPLMNWARSHGTSVRSVPISPIGRGKLHPELENVVEDVPLAADFWLAECEWEHDFHAKVGLCVGSIFNYGLSLAYMTRRCSSGRFLCYVASDGTIFPCTMCAGEKIFASGSVREQPFDQVWRAHWPIRDRSWDDFADSCTGCPINSENYYCASRCPAMSHARHGILNKCGASQFEIESTIYRTQLLNDSPVAPTTNLPVTARERMHRK